MKIRSRVGVPGLQAVLEGGGGLSFRSTRPEGREELWNGPGAASPLSGEEKREF
jgi:hypothetical protein